MGSIISKTLCKSDPRVTGGPSGAATNPIPVRAQYQYKPNTQYEPNINELLSNEVLAIILSKLDLKSQAKAESVCTLWRQTVKDIFASKHTLTINECKNNLVIQKEKTKCKDCVFPYDFVSPSAPEEVIRQTIGQIVAKFRGIRCLSATFSGLKANLIETLCNGCDADIHSLYIVYENEALFIKLSEIQMVVKKYPNLQEFYVKGFRDIRISDSAIRELLKGLPALKKFTLKAPVMELKDRGHVFEGMNAGIKMIDTSSTLFNATAISRLGAKRPDQLRELKLKHFNPQYMALIADNFAKLENFCIGFWCKNSENQVLDLTQVLASISRLVHLQELSISASNNCTQIHGSDIVRLRECPNLHTLTIRCAHMTDNCVKAMVDNIPALKQLTLYNIKTESEDLMDCLAPLRCGRHLRSLGVQMNRKLTDAIIEWLVTNCSHINFIDVSYGARVTIDAMVRCLRFCRQHPNRKLHVIISRHLEKQFNRKLKEKLPNNLVFQYK